LHIDAVAKEKKLSVVQSMHIKRAFEVAGVLDASNNVVTPRHPQSQPAAADRMLAESLPSLS
jgi:hypothetical protein